MISGRFVVCSTFLCLAYSFAAPNRARADTLIATFEAGFSFTSPDATCPGSAHTRDTYSGSGTAALNRNVQFHEPGTSYPATIVYSSCNGLGTVVTGGLFTVTSGTKGSFSGQFDGNYLPAYGNNEYGEYLIKSETGVFAGVDTVGFFDMSPPSGGGQSVLMYTPEPGAAGLGGFGIALLVLFAFRRKWRREVRPAACV